MLNIPFTNIPDPFYLSFELNSEGMNRVRVWRGNNKPISLIANLKHSITIIIKNLINIIKYEDLTINVPVVFFINSINQKNALMTFLDKIQGKIIYSDDPNFSKNCPPIWIIQFYGFLYLPILLYCYLFAKGYKKLSMKHFFRHYLSSYGIFHYFKKLFKNNKKIKVGIVTNDHSHPNRAFFLAAKNHGVASLYIQHASTTPAFPPLGFKYAVLDGFDALHKYDNLGESDTICFLTGVPRLDNYISKPKKITEKIGICFNNISPIKKVEDLIRLLKKGTTQSLIVRPHPGDMRREWKKFCNSLGVELSNSKSELAFDFLQNVNVIISASSNIILEAAFMNVYPLKYSFLPVEGDGYSFLKNGIIDKAYTDPKDIVNAINTNTYRTNGNFHTNSKYYCDTLGTSYEGRSSGLAIDLIKQIIEKGYVYDLSKWKEVHGLKNVKAYRLRDI